VNGGFHDCADVIKALLAGANPAAYERENYLSVLDSFTPPPGVRY